MFHKFFIYVSVFLLCAFVQAGDKYLEAAVGFADCMIEHGRDRYGEVHSPLFAVLLIRSEKPHIGPQPLFDPEVKYDWQRQLKTRFKVFNYNRCLNYPEGLGSEGPHKVTLSGCDPYEDRALYEFLFDLSRITGEPRYRQEAEKALRWWFENTLSENGLYPWGEHPGWDFEYDCPSYFKGPSKNLHGACYHEIKDVVPFLDILAALPAQKTGGLTPLEKYALGIWNAHFWDKERCIYCRHGDYTGEDDRKGSMNGFPAHYAAYLRVWIKTLLVSGNSDVKQQVEEIISRTLDVQIVRAEKYGFIPMTFKPDLQGAKPKSNSQSKRLGRHAGELSLQLKPFNSDLSGKLSRLAGLLGSAPGGALSSAPASSPSTKLRDFSTVTTPAKYAKEIIRQQEWYKQTKNIEHLGIAEKYASDAYSQFIDKKSPLPKAYAGPLHKTPSGETFPDFYFRGAKLMHAFALLGEMKLHVGCGK